MKIFFKIFGLCCLLALAQSGFAAVTLSDDHGDHIKQKNLFVFNTTKNLVGGQVQIFSSDGNLISAQKLLKKKMIIDFGDSQFGAYTIRVTKGVITKEFHYVKK